MNVSNILISDNMIEIVCSGRVSSFDLNNLIDKVKSLLKEKKEIRNILVDLTGIEGKLSFMEHFNLGEEIAKKLSGFRLAVVTKPIVVNKTAENVATKKGVFMLMTYKRKEAISWFTNKK